MIANITINEHSSIRIGGETILYFDPFRITKETHDADIVFITHAHYDHFSPEDIKKIKQEDTLFIMPLSMKEEAGNLSISSDKVYYLSPGNEIMIGNLSVQAVASYNTNKPMHPKENGWLGYVVTIEGQKIYVAGDTDVTEEAKRTTCHIAMLPIGGTYTMDAREAAMLVNQMKPETVVPTHYGTLVGKPEDADVFEPLVDSAIAVCRKL